MKWNSLTELKFSQFAKVNTNIFYAFEISIEDYADTICQEFGQNSMEILCQKRRSSEIQCFCIEMRLFKFSFASNRCTIPK